MKGDAKVFGDAELVNFFAQLPESIKEALRQKWDDGLQHILMSVESNLSGLVLNKRTGNLSDSVKGTAAVRYGDRVRITIKSGGTKAPYAAIQEEGGIAPIPVIFPVKAKALSFIGRDGARVYAAWTRAHPSVIPARPYLKPAVDEWLATLASDLQIVLQEAMIGSGFRLR